MNYTFTFTQLIVLAFFVVISYWIKWKMLLILAAFGIWLYSFTIISTNMPFSVVGFLFGIFTFAYGWLKG